MPKLQSERLLLYLGSESTPDNLQLFFKSCRDANNHVVDQGSVQAVQRLVELCLTPTGNLYCRTIMVHERPWMQLAT
jgi:hypothetical protein